MNAHQRVALTNHCRLSFETMHPDFIYVMRRRNVSIVLTVNSGYE